MEEKQRGCGPEDIREWTPWIRFHAGRAGTRRGPSPEMGRRGGEGFTGDFGALCGNRPPEDPSWYRAPPPAVMLTLRFDQNLETVRHSPRDTSTKETVL